MTFAMVKVLPRAGDAEQRLVRQAGLQALDELVDRLRLVAGGLVIRLRARNCVCSMCESCRDGRAD